MWMRVFIGRDAAHAGKSSLSAVHDRMSVRYFQVFFCDDRHGDFSARSANACRLIMNKAGAQEGGSVRMNNRVAGAGERFGSHHVEMESTLHTPNASGVHPDGGMAVGSSKRTDVRCRYRRSGNRRLMEERPVPGCAVHVNHLQCRPGLRGGHPTRVTPAQVVGISTAISQV
jgi:hypothetical protein